MLAHREQPIQPNRAPDKGYANIGIVSKGFQAGEYRMLGKFDLMYSFFILQVRCIVQLQTTKKRRA